MSDDSFDLLTTFVHLGRGARAIPIPDFRWEPDFIQQYQAEHEDDGDEARLVALLNQTRSAISWERHPAGDEFALLLSGKIDIIQYVDGSTRTVELKPGLAAINPAGVWHRTVVHEPGQGLFITPGRGTEHRPPGARLD
jgi:mannose-6-phosphate isomerase-like protein (cupin superfamily)